MDTERLSELRKLAGEARHAHTYAIPRDTSAAEAIPLAAAVEELAAEVEWLRGIIGWAIANRNASSYYICDTILAEATDAQP